MHHYGKTPVSFVPAFRRDNPINVKEPANLFRLAYQRPVDGLNLRSYLINGQEYFEENLNFRNLSLALIFKGNKKGRMPLWKVC